MLKNLVHSLKIWWKKALNQQGFEKFARRGVRCHIIYLATLFGRPILELHHLQIFNCPLHQVAPIISLANQLEPVPASGLCPRTAWVTWSVVKRRHRPSHQSRLRNPFNKGCRSPNETQSASSTRRVQMTQTHRHRAPRPTSEVVGRKPVCARQPFHTPPMRPHTVSLDHRQQTLAVPRSKKRQNTTSRRLDLHLILKHKPATKQLQRTGHLCTAVDHSPELDFREYPVQANSPLPAKRLRLRTYAHWAVLPKTVPVVSTLPGLRKLSWPHSTMASPTQLMEEEVVEKRTKSGKNLFTKIHPSSSSTTPTQSKSLRSPISIPPNWAHQGEHFRRNELFKSGIKIWYVSLDRWFLTGGHAFHRGRESSWVLQHGKFLNGIVLRHYTM